MVALSILGAGMALALAWIFWNAVVLGKGYPEGYLFGSPSGRFADFADVALVSTLQNPYADPTALYPPTVYAALRIGAGHDNACLILIDFVSTAALGLLLTHLLLPVITGPLSRVSIAFLFLVLSYPVLFCLDRGNLDIILVACVGWAIYFYGQNRTWTGTACLFPAICLKLYPVIFLALLLRRGKIGQAIICGMAALIVIFASACLLPAPLFTMWNSYRDNMETFRDYYILSNAPLEGSASPWNAYKIVLIAWEKWGNGPIINYGFDGPFINISYKIYAATSAFVTAICAGYVWFFELKIARGAVLLLLLASMLTPSGGDYRLMFASLALAWLLTIPRRRTGDWTALVLIAFAVNPKKEILLTFVGLTETNYADVPLQALLNPPLILAAMAVLVYNSLPIFNRQHRAIKP